jgi:hypothetical protein
VPPGGVYIAFLTAAVCQASVSGVCGDTALLTTSAAPDGEPQPRIYIAEVAPAKPDARAPAQPRCTLPTTPNTHKSGVSTAKNGALLPPFSRFRFCGAPKNGALIFPNAV